AGPRTIGVAIDPLVLAAGLVILAAAGAICLWYLRRKGETVDDED
ncbi:MAG: hypothetical protein GYA23_09780, partial [Methanomicrobiales archaeon]|nr:hypothetical protein [Methanomicrobiales archaeon]